MEVIGVNEPGQFTSPTMFSGKPCSWIRDSLMLNVKAAWSANYRDTIILDPINGKIDVYNLTANNLQIPENRATLKAKLVAAASVADADTDGIPDYWEQWALGGTAAGALDPAAGGVTLLESYALCGGPAGAPPAVSLIPDATGVTLRFIRRRGTAFGLTVTPQLSTDLGGWGPGVEFGALVTHPLYDGSGGESVEWRTSSTAIATRFARLLVAVP